ncbi:hypothetical protein DPQ22_05105 [Candidatus Tokpelaia sp.]|nr:hypothetical protein DPQ22_05105 [Candidatus Tokpelaia sp.]
MMAALKGSGDMAAAKAAGDRLYGAERYFARPEAKKVGLSGYLVADNIDGSGIAGEKENV